MKIRGAFEQVLEVASSVSAMSGVELVNYIYSSFGSVAQYRRCRKRHHDSLYVWRQFNCRHEFIIIVNRKLVISTSGAELQYM